MTPEASAASNHHTERTFGDDGAAPDTCMCTCVKCWDDGYRRGLGRCLCPDCRNPHHDHRGRPNEAKREAVVDA